MSGFRGIPGALALACVLPVLSHADGYGADVRLRLLMKTDTTSLGARIVYPATDSAEVTAFEATIPPGGETGWHRHPYPGYAYVLEGELTLEVEGGRQLVLKAGEPYAELVGVRHNGRNLGKVPVKLVAFFTGVKGRPLTEK
jgi:quercetin dioxygenase-like cupin family protein